MVILNFSVLEREKSEASKMWLKYQADVLIHKLIKKMPSAVASTLWSKTICF